MVPSRVALVAVLVATVWTMPARAASCTPLITDPRGDGTVSDPQSGAQLVAVGDDPALDLLTADVAANRSLLSVVVRTSGDMRATPYVAGHDVELTFVAIGESLWNLSATFPAVGPLQVSLGVVQGSDVGTGAVSGAGEVSPDGRSVRMTIPTGAFAELSTRPLRVGDKLSRIHLYSNRAVAVENSGVFSPAPADAATTSRTYRVGDRSCVRP